MNAGLNLLRFFLALNVVAFHLWNAAAPGAGPVAVMGFFCVSGFLITKIVQEVYRMPGAAGAFLLNRMLRIYPSYLVALALGLLAIRLYPEVAAHVNSYLKWPATAAEWWPQLAIFGLTDSGVRVLPATWTLATELVYYLLIGLGTGRSRRATWLLLLASLPVGLACALNRLPFTFYGSAVGNGFVFALGSLAYFYRDRLSVGPRLFALACAAWAIALYGIPALEQSDLDTANLASSVLPFLVILLFVVQVPVRSPGWVRLASALGRAAYPLFLLHWAASVLISAWLFEGRASFDLQGLRAGGGYFAAVCVLAIGGSLLFVQLIDRPMERWRNAVRLRGRKGAAATSRHNAA